MDTRWECQTLDLVSIWNSEFEVEVEDLRRVVS